MKKIAAIITVLFLAIVSLAVLYFSKLDGSSKNNGQVLAYIPRTAAMVAGFRNDRSIYGIFRDYPFFEAILGKTRIGEWNALRDLLGTGPLQEISDGKSVFLSFHTGSNGQMEVLFLLTLGAAGGDAALLQRLTPSLSAAPRATTIAGRPVSELSLPGVSRPFYVYLESNLVAGTFSKALLQQSLSKNTPKISKQFISEINQGSLHDENSPVNLFVEHPLMAGQLSAWMNPGRVAFADLLRGWNGSSVLNLNYKTDALMFSGISKTDSAAASFFALFLGQQPVPCTLPSIFPPSTAGYASFGVSDFPKFSSRLRTLFSRRGELKKLTEQFDAIAQSSGMETRQLQAPLTASEFAVFQLANQEKLGAVKVADGLALKSNLDPVSTAVSDDVRQFNYSNVPYFFFGDPFRSFFRPYFTIVDNYLVLANSKKLLDDFLAGYLQGKLLSRSVDFITFNQFIADRSSISMFAQTSNSRYFLRSLLRPAYATLFDDTSYGWNNFYGWSLQMSADGDHFFTSIYANFPSAPAPQSPNP